MRKTLRIFEGKAAAVKSFLEKFRHYLLSAPFILYSDHAALIVEFGKVAICGRWTKRLDRMPKFELEIRHVIGGQSTVTDRLLRCSGGANDSGVYKTLSTETFLNKGTAEEKMFQELLATTTQ